MKIRSDTVTVKGSSSHMPLPKGGKGERAVNRARRPAGTLDRDLRTTDPIEAAPSLGVCFYSAAAAVGRFLFRKTSASGRWMMQRQRARLRIFSYSLKADALS